MEFLIGLGILGLIMVAGYIDRREKEAIERRAREIEREHPHWFK